MITFEDSLGENDPAVMPIYDVNGYIAGISTAVSSPCSPLAAPTLLPPCSLPLGENDPAVMPIYDVNGYIAGI